MASVEFPISFDPSPALDEVAILYERYYQSVTVQPFDVDACSESFLAWKAAMNRLFGLMQSTKFDELQNQLSKFLNPLG
jgi:hypothetical protein